MIYRQKNKNRHTKSKLVLALLLLLIIFRLFNVDILSAIFEKPLNYILKSNTIVLSPIKNTVAYFKDNSDLRDKVKELETENINLKLENLLNKTLEQEYEFFKNEFGTTTRIDQTYKVILRPPFTPFDNIRIVGNLEQRKVEDLVFYRNILIGKIIKIDNNYAVVELFSTPNKITPVTVNGVQFEAKGLGGGRFIFEVSKDFEIQDGEAIVYPAETLTILGVAEFIETKEEDLFKKVYFNLPISLDKISYVTVGI